MADCSDFQQFINERCRNRTQILQSPHVAPHFNTIQYLLTTNTNNCNIFSENAPQPLQHFKTFYLENYAAIPSSTHLAESTVKDANLCQHLQRTEHLASTYATARSGIVDVINKNASTEWNKENLKVKGNAFVSGGSSTSRIDKRTGQQFAPKEYRQNI